MAYTEIKTNCQKINSHVSYSKPKKITSFSSCGHRQLALIWKYFIYNVSWNESIFNFLDNFPMNNIIPRLKQEILAIIPPTIFFFTAFQLIAFTRALMLEEYGIQVSTFMTASIAALIVSKVVLVVDLLPFVNRFPEKPLIYNVAWKTAIYITATFIVRYIEHLIPFIRKHGDLVLANRNLLNEVVWPHFWAVHIWLFVFFFVYCAIRELVRALGKERIRSMFFGPPL